MTLPRILILIALSLSLLVLWLFGPSEVALIAFIKLHLDNLRELYAVYPVLFSAVYFIVYAIATSFIPVGIVMMLLGGAIFPFWLGTMIVCTAYSVGATANFLIARYIMGDTLQVQWAWMRRVVEQDGWFYLLVMRLIPFIPAQGISFAMGATKLSIPAFFTATWLGDLPLSAFCIYMGHALAHVERSSDLLSAPAMLAMTGIALVLLLARLGLQQVQKRMAS